MYTVSIQLWWLSIQILYLQTNFKKFVLSKTTGQQLFCERKESITCLGIYTTSGEISWDKKGGKWACPSNHKTSSDYIVKEQQHTAVLE